MQNLLEQMMKTHSLIQINVYKALIKQLEQKDKIFFFFEKAVFSRNPDRVMTYVVDASKRP